MTRIGVISDVHADVHSLERAIKRMRQMECDKIICLGDVIDYGLFPDETVELLASSDDITTIRGNHCRWAIDERPSKRDLSRATLTWLKDRSPRWDESCDGIQVAARHGSPKGDMDGIYHDRVTLGELDAHLDKAETTILLVGHTHVPMKKHGTRGRLVCNPGALLRDPADAYKLGPWNKLTQTWGDPELRCPGTFGVLELPKKSFRVYRAHDGSEVELG